MKREVISLQGLTLIRWLERIPSLAVDPPHPPSSLRPNPLPPEKGKEADKIINHTLHSLHILADFLFRKTCFTFYSVITYRYNFSRIICTQNMLWSINPCKIRLPFYCNYPNYRRLTYPGNSVSTMFSNWSISWRIPGGSSGAGLLLFPPSSQVPSFSSILMPYAWRINWVKVHIG